MINIPAPLLEALLSVLRSSVIGGGAYFAGKGWLPPGIVEPLAVLVTVAAPMAWGAWQKFEADKKTRALVAAAITEPRNKWTDETRAELELLKSTTGAG